MRVLVTGASGLLGRYLLAEPPDDVTILGWSGRPSNSVGGLPLMAVDLTRPRILEGAYRMLRPAVVLHLAACANLADCVRDPALAHAVNTRAAEILARLVKADGGRIIYTSTDLVFDGTAPPYREDDVATPLSIYGRSKLAGEAAVLAAGGTVVRLALLYGPGREGRVSFFDTMQANLIAGEPVRLFRDEFRTPLDLRTAAAILWRFARMPGQGLVHAGGAERMSRLEMGQRLARFLGIASPNLLSVERASVPSTPPRAADTSLDSSRLAALLPELVRPTYERALEAMLGG